MEHKTADVQEHQEYAPRPKPLWIHPRVHQRLKSHLANHGGSLQEAAKEAVNEWIDKREAELLAEEK